MENLEEIINQKLEIQVNQIERGRKYYNMDWPQVRRLVSELVPTIVDTIVEIIEHEEKLDEKLIRRLNQISFNSNPERDKKIIELYNQNMSKAQIARAIKMSAWGVSKALKRLGVK